MGAAREILDTKFLKSLIPMADMDPSGFNQLAGNYSIEHYKPGDTIFKRGEHENQTLYLISGELILQFISGKEQKLVATSEKARHALAPEQPRKATATAVSPVSILSIDSELLDELLYVNNRNGYEVTEIQGENDSDWMTKFLQSKVFLKLPAQNIQALMMRLEEVQVTAGQVIIRQGDDDGNYYIVKSGRCKVTRRHTPHDNEIELAVLTAGSGFGEEAIITNNRRGATITMLCDGCLMRLSRDDFTCLLVEPLIREAKYEDLVLADKNVFLDVRPYDDYIKDGITKSQNISLSEMRSKVHVLDHKNHYVICSNTGSRAAAASFLLGQHGFDTVVLSQGLAGLPADVERGNSNGIDEDIIPLVDNVVSFIPAQQPQIVSNQEQGPQQITTEMALNEPRVSALFSKARQRVQLEAQRALDADAARIEAEKQLAKLHAETQLARAQVIETHDKVEVAAKLSAEKARAEAIKESAKLREFELGCKEAEMEEAVRQAEEEANRAREAINAKLQAEKETELLKRELQKSVAYAKQEADKSEKLEAEKQKLDAARKIEEESQRAQTAEQARKQAEVEIERIKDEALSMRRHAKQEVETVRQQLEQERQMIAERARVVAEAARAEVAEQTDKISAEKQTIIDEAILTAEQHAQRTEEVEIARNQAEEEIKRLKLEAEAARLQIQDQLSADITRSEIEHEVARTRAIELANKQSEIEDMTDAAEVASQRAMLAEQGHTEAQQEIECLRTKLEAAAEQSQADSGNSEESADQDSQQSTQNNLVDMQAEIEIAGQRAEEEAVRAEQAEQARQQAAEEIERLQAEVEVATLQAQTQQRVDAERAKVENQMVEQLSVELAQKEADMLSALALAAKEEQRAKEIEEAKKLAEEEVSRLKVTEQAHVLAQKEIQRLNGIVYVHAQKQVRRSADEARKSAKQEIDKIQAEEEAKKQAEMLEVERRAKENAQRAEIAERERHQAEVEIKRLKAEADKERIKAKRAIEDSIKAAKRGNDEKLIKLRARKKARRVLEMERDKPLKNKKKPRKPASSVRNTRGLSPNPNRPLSTYKSERRTSERAVEKVQSEWVSDQAMWETTLGIREDTAIDRMDSPDLPIESPSLNKPVQNGVRNLDAKESAANDADLDSNQRAVFTARDINPYINSQIVEPVRRTAKKFGMRRIIIAFLGCCVLAFASYYWLLSEEQQIFLNDKVLSRILSEASITKLTGKPKQKKQQKTKNLKPIAGRSKKEARQAKSIDIADRIKLKAEAGKHAQFRALSAEINRSIQKQRPKTNVVVEPDPVGASMASQSQQDVSTQAPLVTNEKQPTASATAQTKEIEIQIDVVDPLASSNGQPSNANEPQINESQVGQQAIDVAEKQPVVSTPKQAKGIEIQIDVVDPLASSNGQPIKANEPQIKEPQVGQQAIDVAPLLGKTAEAVVETPPPVLESEKTLKTNQEIIQEPFVFESTTPQVQQPVEESSVGGINQNSQ